MRADGTAGAAARYPLPFGSTIGMLGGGQLGRMSILAGRRMGYRFVVLDPVPGCAAASVADAQIVAPYDDPDGLAQLAKAVDRVTLEFENIPMAALQSLADHVDVYPCGQVLHICQNRAREKEFLSAHGIPCAPYAIVGSEAELRSAVARIGFPAVLKTADFGYDGKGQVRIDEESDLAAVWSGYVGCAAVLEGWVRFRGEYSIICGRNPRGEVCCYPLVANTHRHHILLTSVSPVSLPAGLQAEAQELARRLCEAIGLVGILAIELFLTDGGWVVNELAPRPHNSGHLTIEANVTSQFEQHIRMVCGLPHGDTALMRPAAMLNLLGDLWQDGPPDFGRELMDPRCKLHLYDKGEPRPGRKMGHLTFLGDDAADCEARALAAFGRLAGNGCDD